MVATDVVAVGTPGLPVLGSDSQTVITTIDGKTSGYIYDANSAPPGPAYDAAFAAAAAAKVAAESSRSSEAAAGSTSNTGALTTTESLQTNTVSSAAPGAHSKTTPSKPSDTSQNPTSASPSESSKATQTHPPASSEQTNSPPSSTLDPLTSTSRTGTERTPTSSKSTLQPTQTPAPIRVQDKVGFKAGIGVAAAVITIALIVIALLIFRRRRRRNRGRTGHALPAPYSSTSNGDPNINSVFSDKPYAAIGGGGASRNGPVANLATSLDDKTVHGKFSQLDSAIQDFVVSSFRNGTPKNAASVDASVAALLGNISSEWPTLLTHDQRSRYILLRGLVACVLSSAYTNGELLGDTEVSQLNKRLSAGAHSAPASQWRAKSLSLLTSSPQRLEASQAAIDRIVDYIEAATTEVVKPPSTSSSERLRKLRQLVTTTSDLAFELALQNVDFEWNWGTHQNSKFEKGEMEDVLQEKNERQMDGRHIKAFVFPNVRRWGSDEDGGWEQARGIRKGSVLV